MGLPNPPSGSSSAANWFRRIWDRLRAQRIAPGVGYKVRETSDGTFLDIQTGGGGSSSAQISEFKLNTVEGDYLNCFARAGTTWSTVTVSIAKPHKLRNSITLAVLDGITVTYSYYEGTVKRMARHDSAAEIQIVLPRYLSEDIILAAKIDATGVTGHGSTQCEYLDINEGARAWARKYIQS